MNVIEKNILQQMVDRSEEICFVFNVKELRFQYVNDAFDLITERKTKDLIDHPEKLLKSVHKEDLKYVKDKIKLLLKKKTNSLLNFRIHRPDKTEKWIRLKVYPIQEKKEITYLTGFAEDDTLRKAGIFNMQKINGWKNSTLEILSHDLRGPISTVKMLASLIAKKLPDNEEIIKLTSMIEEISKRNILLIQTVLKKESLATASVEMSLERLDVVWEVNQAMDVYVKSQDNIHKTFKLTHSHPVIYAEVDSMQFLQIVNNLISNAIKFTKDNGHIDVHIEQKERSFLVTVADDGIGIPKSLQPALFNKYTKAGRKGIEGEETIGLGMWIVKSLTERHGGKVWFESKARKGSTFYVALPLGLWNNEHSKKTAKRS